MQAESFFALFAVILLIGVLIRVRRKTNTDWQAPFAKRAEISVQDNLYHIQGLRDFRYASPTQSKAIHYRHNTYNINQLKRCWLGISHFGHFGLAHVFVSFEFEQPTSEPEYLVFSVEARLRHSQQYNPIVGLFRQYERIIVIGTEADVIGLRSFNRQEKVFLYPMQLSEMTVKHFFEGLIKEACDQKQQPFFYNTLLHNCATSLLQHDPQYSVWKHLLDFRVLLPGYGDQFAQQKHWIDTSQPLSVLQERSRIPASIHPDHTEFSRLIRSHRLQTSAAEPDA